VLVVVNGVVVVCVYGADVADGLIEKLTPELRGEFAKLREKITPDAFKRWMQTQQADTQIRAKL